MAKPRDGARHEASRRKLKRASQKGERPQSRQLGQALTFLLLLLLLFLRGEDWLQQVRELSRHAFAGDGEGLAQRALLLLGRISAGVGLPLAICAFLLGLVQVGPLFRLRIDASRLNPIKGLGRMFSAERLADLCWMLVRVVILSVLAWILVAKMGTVLFRAFPDSLGSWAVAVGGRLNQGLLWMGLAGLLLGLGDWRLQRRRFLRGLRMTDDERKREHKEQEGDPGIKAERRRRHKETLSGGLADLRQAKVLVINPSHVAAALRYRPEEDEAPVLLLAGRGAMAQRMRREAQRLGLPMLEHVSLARALLACPVGQCIPGHLFAAAAEVLRTLREPVDAARMPDTCSPISGRSGSGNSNHQ